MTVSPAQWRLMLAACIVLLVLVSVVVAFGVIPPVRVATVPEITPEDAVPAFLVAVGLHLLAALVILLVVTLSKARTGRSTSSLFITGVLVLLLGLLLSDAALAFREAGATMQIVATLLLACVVADALAGALSITSALLRPKTPPKRTTAA